MRDLSFYRDAQFYPQEHPRRRGRINSIHEKLVAYERRFRTTVHLQVREGTIFSANQPVDRASRFTKELSTLLRERMTLLVQIRPGVTPEEAQRLADFLISKRVPIQGPRQWSLGPNIQMYRFESGFSDGEHILTEEEVLAAEDEASKPKGRSPLQSLLESMEIHSRLEKLLGTHQDENTNLNFLRRLFEVLRLDSRLDVMDFDSIRIIVEASLTFLERARETPGTAERMNLLSSTGVEGCDLGEGIRWQLLRRFVPGELLPDEPRDETDLDTYARAREGAVPDPDLRASRVDWKPAPLKKLKKWFEGYHAKQHYLVEYLSMIIELVRQDESRDWELRDAFFNQITYSLQEEHAPRELAAFFKEETAEELAPRTGWEAILPPDVIESTGSVLAIDQGTANRLLQMAERLPKGSRTSWQVALLRRLVRPSDVLATLSGGNALFLDMLINRPPGATSELPGNTPDEIVGPLATLRQCIAAKDDYALDIAFSLLTGERRDQSVAAGWPDVFKEAAAMHPALASWIKGRVDALIRQEADLVMTSLPLQPLTMALRDHLHEIGNDEQLDLIAKLSEIDTPHVTRLLTIGATSSSDRVRRVTRDAIGTRFGKASRIILESLLENQNHDNPSLAEVTHLCRLLAFYQGAAGQEALENIATEKKGILHKWSRLIRKEAKAALTACRTTVGTRYGKASCVLLETLLENQNHDNPNVGEVAHLCRMLAFYQGEAGQEALENITTEKTGLRHKWSRLIRKEAKAALSACKREREAP